MNAAGPRSPQADAKFAGPFGIAARIEGSGFFVADLDEANPILSRSQCFNDAVDAVSGQPENRVDVPFGQRFDKNIAGGTGSHRICLMRRIR